MNYVTRQNNVIFATPKLNSMIGISFSHCYLQLQWVENFLLTVKTKASEWKNIQNSLTAMSVTKRVVYMIFHHVKLQISFKWRYQDANTLLILKFRYVNFTNWWWCRCLMFLKTLQYRIDHIHLMQCRYFRYIVSLWRYLSCLPTVSEMEAFREWKNVIPGQNVLISR